MREAQSILLITDNSSADLKRYCGIDMRQVNADMLIVTAETSVGIDDIRFIKEFCRTPPFKEKEKTVIIPDAGIMTREAQNAFLKTLEEPPGYARIILVSQETHPFLETVLSRCLIVYGKSGSAEPVESPAGELERLRRSLPPARLNALPSSLKSKQPVSEYCRGLIREASQALARQPDKDTLYNLRLLHHCLESLTKNANPTIAITDTVLRLK